MIGKTILHYKIIEELGPWRHGGRLQSITPVCTATAGELRKRLVLCTFSVQNARWVEIPPRVKQMALYYREMAFEYLND